MPVSPLNRPIVYGACDCRVWPLGMPEAVLMRMGRCGYCDTAPVPPFFKTEQEAQDAREARNHA